METNEELQTAVALWCDDEDAAAAVYGRISRWNTGLVTDMSYLFGADWDGSQWIGRHCSTYATFNADISAWNGKCGAIDRHQLT